MNVRHFTPDQRRALEAVGFVESPPILDYEWMSYTNATSVFVAYVTVKGRIRLYCEQTDAYTYATNRNDIEAFIERQSQ